MNDTARCQRHVRDGTFLGHTCNRPVKPGHDICAVHVGADKRSNAAYAASRAKQRQRDAAINARAQRRKAAQQAAARVQAFLDARAPMRGLDSEEITGAEGHMLTVSDLQALVAGVNGG